MTQIKLRRDTSAAFASSNPILGNGEPAYETDTKKLKIGDGTTAYTQLEYFSAGGGGSTNITATLPLKIVDGVISLEVDGQTIQIVDGKLHANLDELGNEVNSLTGEVTDLSGRVTAAEAGLANKQDILTPIQPLTIQNKIISNLVGMEYTGDGTGVYGAYSLESSDGVFESNNLGNNADFGSSWSATSIPCYIDIPYTFGQIVKVPSGTYGYTWNKSIGKLLSDGTFIPICTFYPSDITISDTLKSFRQFRAEWKTKGTERTSGSGFSVANGQAGCSYIQFIDNGSTIRCLAYYGNGNAAPSTSINYTITNNTDIQRLREIQVVRIFPNRQNYGVSSNPYPVDRFGLYDGATTLDTLGNFNNLGENLFDLSSQVARNYLEVQVDGTTITTNSSGQLQANIPSNLTTQGNTFNGANQLVKLDNSGKLPAVDGSNLTNLPGGGSAPANMVTTDTEQTISGNKELTGITTISNDIKFTIGKKITTPDGEWLMQLGPGSIGIGTSMKPLKTYDGSNYYLHNKSIIAGDGIKITEPNSSEIEISSTNTTPVRYPVEVSDKSLLPSWYVVYNDGWCEQGGRYTINTDGSGTITFLKEFVNTSYTIFNSKESTDSSTWTVMFSPAATWTTSQVDIKANLTGYKLGGSWEAKGYIK